MPSQPNATFGLGQTKMIVPDSRLSLAGFFNNRQYADVLVTPDDGSASGWLCHSVILAAGSSTLSRVLSTGEYSLHQPLTLAGVSSTALESLLRFLYTSELAISVDSVVPILDAALKLGITPVAALAQQYINKPGVLAISSAAHLLSQAVDCKQEPLIRLILSFCESRYKEVIADSNFSTLSQEALSIFLAHHRKVQPLQGLLDAANAWCGSDQQRLDTALQMLTNQMHELLPKHQERPQPALPSSAASQQPVMQAQQSIHQTAMVPDNQTMQTQEVHQRQQMLPLSKNSMVPQPGGGWTIPITSTAQVMQSLQARSPRQNTTQQQQFTLRFDGPAQATQHTVATTSHFAAHQQAGYVFSTTEGPHGPLTVDGKTGTHNNAWNPVAYDKGTSNRQQAENEATAKPSAKDSWMATVAAEAINQSLTVRQSSSVSSAERVERHSLSVPQSTINSQNLYMSGGTSLHGIPTLDLNAHMPQPSNMALNMSNQQHASEAQPSHSSDRSGKMAPFDDGPAAGVIATAAQLMSLNTAGRAATAKTHITAALSGPSHQTSAPRRGRPTNESKAAGAMPSRGVCHIDNCYADLSGLRDYHQRFRICDYHLKVSCVMRDGQPQRFCQQCGRFHPLEEFDGNKRSCRSRLQKHNARRRKRSDLPEDSGNSSPQHNSSKRSVFGSGALLSAYRNSSISPLRGGPLRYAGLPGELTVTDGLAGDNIDSDNMDDNVDPETAGLLGLVSLASGRPIRHSNLPVSPICPIKSVPAHLVNSSAADMNNSMEYDQDNKQEINATHN